MEDKWTIESLKEYFERILEEKEKALTIALDSAKEAVNIAEKNAEKWRDSANEWRSAMNDKDKNFLTKAEFLTYKESTEKALSAEKERGDKGAGRTAGITQFIGYIIAALTILGFVLTYLIK